MITRRRLLGAVCAVFVVAVVIWATQRSVPDLVIQSARFPGRVRTHDHTLHLVGAGVRRVMMFTPYAAALYLERPVATAAEVLSSDQAKRVHLHLLADLDRVQIDWAFRKAVERNNPKSLPQLAPQLEVLYGVLRDAKRGEDIVINYVPDVGTSVVTGRDVVPTLPGADLGTAMMSIWFGPLSVDADLQRAMLGIEILAP